MWKIYYKRLGSLVCKERLQINFKKSKQSKPKCAENMGKDITEQEISVAYEKLCTNFE